jgi:hypothetical protein
MTCLSAAICLAVQRETEDKVPEGPRSSPVPRIAVCQTLRASRCLPLHHAQLTPMSGCGATAARARRSSANMIHRCACGDIRAWVRATGCRAALNWRSPERDSRWRACSALATSIGAVPDEYVARQLLILSTERRGMARKCLPCRDRECKCIVQRSRMTPPDVVIDTKASHVEGKLRRLPSPSHPSC